jgi:glycosyltransferase involved in cell wall biosynthesis
MAETKSSKPRVLMVAYACNPKGGGEHWLGWGWAEQAARAYDVILITPTNHISEVKAAAAGRGITVHFVTIPEWFKKLTLYLGEGGSWLRKIYWQSRAARLAKKLHRESPFALVHQTTFHTFRVPFLASELEIPSVWGPVAGGEHVPPGFARYLGPGKYSEALRHLVNRLWLHFPPVSKSLRRASVIFVSNRTTLDFLPSSVHGKCQIVPPNALRPEDENESTKMPRAIPGATLRLLYVGNCVATRVLPLVFEALVESKLKDYKLTIAGKGPTLGYWKKRAIELGLEGRVEFLGQVPYAELSRHYAEADALVFPALRDSGGSALLEAMSRNLPVICLDWAGPGEIVAEGCGIKISVRDPSQTVALLANAFKQLNEEPELRESLARAARKRVQGLFRWDEKFRLLQSCYTRLMNKP